MLVSGGAIGNYGSTNPGQLRLWAAAAVVALLLMLRVVGRCIGQDSPSVTLMVNSSTGSNEAARKILIDNAAQELAVLRTTT